jgi:hypothetical protein
MGTTRRIAQAAHLGFILHRTIPIRVYGFLRFMNVPRKYGGSNGACPKLNKISTRADSLERESKQWQSR